MKERDIVDFEKLKETNPELFDENGEFKECRICYTHTKAYEKFKDESLLELQIPKPICPNCGEMVHYAGYGSDSVIVSEVNYPNPDGEIGYYSIWDCPSCGANFSLMPVLVNYNANHDIFYTGGKDYLYDKDMKEVSKKIFDAVYLSIKQYVDRKLNPENGVDERLNEKNIEIWTSRDIEHAIAEIMYDHGFKK